MLEGEIRYGAMLLVSKSEFNFTPLCQMDLDLFCSVSHYFAAIINEGCIDLSMNLFYYCRFVHNS